MGQQTTDPFHASGGSSCAFDCCLPARITIHVSQAPEIVQEGPDKGAVNENRLWGFRVDCRPLEWKIPERPGEDLSSFTIYQSNFAFPTDTEAQKSALAQWRHLETQIEPIVALIAGEKASAEESKN